MSGANHKAITLSRDLPFSVVDANQELLPQKLLDELIDSSQ